MITMNGIRNGFWCCVALGIVACASAPMPVDKLAVAQTSVQRAEQAQAAQFAQVELNTARTKLTAAQAAADKRDAEMAATRPTSTPSWRKPPRAPSSSSSW